MTTKDKKKSPPWLRILEISAGLMIIAPGVAAFYPGVAWSRTALLAFLAVALIILEIAYILRIFANGISGRRRLNLILSVLAILIAVLVLVLSFYVVLSYYGFILTLLNLLALGLLFAGIASAVRGTVGGIIVGSFGIFIGVFVLIDLHIAVNVAIFMFLFWLIRPLFPLSTDVAALITLSLTIFGLEPIISGIMGRWI
ncbi:MAG: hypothetical protein WAL97_07330 [Halobacteriota archaeon]